MSGSGSLTYSMQAQLLQHAFLNMVYQTPPFTQIILCTTMPDPTQPGTEVSGGGYQRQNVQNAPATGWNAPFLSGDNVVITNAMTLQWPVATANWGTIVAIGLMTNLNAFEGFAPLVDPNDMVTPLPRPILVGDVFRIPAGNLMIGFGPMSGAVVGIVGADVRRVLT